MKTVSIIHANHKPISCAKWCNGTGPSVRLSEFLEKTPSEQRCATCLARIKAAGRIRKAGKPDSGNG